VRRLCDEVEILRQPVLAEGERGDSALVRQWASLRCPHAGGCDRTARRCDGMNSQNLVTIDEIEGRLFVRGYFKTGG